jgi:hypothetical protein
MLVVGATLCSNWWIPVGMGNCSGAWVLGMGLNMWIFFFLVLLIGGLQCDCCG